MSFKIFSLQLTGKIKSVSVIEKQREKLTENYNSFKKTESSDELKAFLELEKWINSDAFKNKKKEIENLSFKGSKEEKELKDFEKLKKSSAIRKYFSVEGSQDLKRFEKEREGEKMKTYYQLLDYVKEGLFEKEKKEINAQIFRGSVEEKHWLEFKKLSKTAGIKAFLELNGSDAVKKHDQFSGSDKLKKYTQLKETPQLNKEQKEELKRLSHDAEIKGYFKFEQSKKLKRYKETKASHQLTRYQELKTMVESAEFKKQETFLKDKKKFEKSEAFKKYNEYKKLAADDTVKFVLKFEKSALYKNYLDVKDSFDLKRYFELEELTKSEEFKKQKAWLEDKKRWEKTEEFKKEQQYLKEKSIPEFVNYFKYKDSTAFDYFTEQQVVFEDDFSDTKLNREKWSTSLSIADKTLGENYAMPGDLNIFTNGENLRLDKKLQISVRKEKASGKVWKMPAGFVPIEFEYTSGLISSHNSFQLVDGIVEAKIKYDPAKQVVSSLYLQGEKAGNRVNILEMGSRNNLGVSMLNAQGKVESRGLDISNLKKGEYIFALEKQGSTFTWKINDVEVFKEEHKDFNQASHLVASSLVIDEIPGSSPHTFEISWIKCYTRK